MKGRKFTNKKSQDNAKLVIAIKFFSGLKITDKKLVWLLRDYFDIDVTERMIRYYKKDFK